MSRNFFTRNNWKQLSTGETFHKLPNFQLVRPLTLQQQIERFQAAGRKVEELAGLGVFDFDKTQPLDDVLDDPTRDPDFDMIDAATVRRDMILKAQAARAAGTVVESKGSEEKSVSEKVESKKEESGAPPEAARSGPEA